MKKYHLTIIRNGRYVTIFGEMTSIFSFLAMQSELGHETHILYSRELSKGEWETYCQHKKIFQKKFGEKE